VRVSSPAGLAIEIAADGPVDGLDVAVTDAVRRHCAPTVRAQLLARLSPREAQVARRVAAGASNREIAADLVICEDTVKKHVSHALAKLGLHNRTELAIAAAQLFGLLDRLT
jgi:DNA-binding NarL/FixJ family response regulator